MTTFSRKLEERESRQGWISYLVGEKDKKKEMRSFFLCLANAIMALFWSISFLRHPNTFGWANANSDKWSDSQLFEDFQEWQERKEMRKGTMGVQWGERRKEKKKEVCKHSGFLFLVLC